MDLTQNLKLNMENPRTSVEKYYENWYNKVKKPAEKIDIYQTRQNLFICSRQVYGSNQPFPNIKEYFRVSLTISFLNHVSADLEYRFPGD